MVTGGVTYNENGWVSTISGGELSQWKKILIPKGINPIVPHPKHPGWIAGVALSPDCTIAGRTKFCSNDVCRHPFISHVQELTEFAALVFDRLR
jgi:hypothetical protein